MRTERWIEVLGTKKWHNYQYHIYGNDKVLPFIPPLTDDPPEPLLESTLTNRPCQTI